MKISQGESFLRNFHFLGFSVLIVTECDPVVDNYDPCMAMIYEGEAPAVGTSPKNAKIGSLWMHFRTNQQLDFL